MGPLRGIQNPQACLGLSSVQQTAQAALRDQDWTHYGEELKKMRTVLEELVVGARRAVPL